MSTRILSLQNITKAYPGVVALDGVSIDFYEGTVHALLGENGAGKSTLIKIIAGAIEPDEGTIMFADGKQHASMTPALSKAYGVEVIYQEFNLVGCLSVAENVFLGHRFGKLVDLRLMRRKAREIFDRLGVDVDVDAETYTLPSSKQQLVEIAKATAQDARLLIMDEPTAPLSLAEVRKLFALVNVLKSQGVSIIYISHRLEELFEITDTVTVMRDGRKIATMPTASTSRKALVESMVGRDLTETFPVHGTRGESVALSVQGACGSGDDDISFSVKKGEILGIAGLVGAGRTELARMIYGADPMEKGKIFIDGRRVRIGSPHDALKNGIGLIPEDRKQQGCVLERSVRENITLSCLKKHSLLGVVNDRRNYQIARDYASRLQIKSTSLSAPVSSLSGGNQQKVVLAKALATESRILIFDEPTRGIDVGAKQQIYELMARLASGGNAIIMISSEMEELLGMSDRILVMYEGRIVKEFLPCDFRQAAILASASGIKDMEETAHAPVSGQ